MSYSTIFTPPPLIPGSSNLTTESVEKLQVYNSLLAQGSFEANMVVSDTSATVGTNLVVNGGASLGSLTVSSGIVSGALISTSSLISSSITTAGLVSSASVVVPSVQYASKSIYTQATSQTTSPRRNS
jgi:hypothetical protein